ncbi:MAG: hypothetical protein BRC32_01860 [Actinobacteria bacterium QS_8_72_14]|nr:MAG: hypothetical protein BRC32_01860 [Actinobacteria bacterium QS_8_72_14]
MDTTALESAYTHLLDLARGGGFAAPADDDAWTASRLLARVVVGDRLLAATTAEVAAGGAAAYSDAPADRTALLDEVARAHDGLEELIAELRRGGLVLVRLVRALDDDVAARVVSTHLVDGGVTRVNAPMPWSGVLNTHAEVHLPEHAARLEALQGGG